MPAAGLLPRCGGTEKMTEPKKKLLFAEPRGFCGGVRRALALVDELLERRQGDCPVYVFHEIVHNNFVVKNLKEKNVIFVDRLDAVPDGTDCVFSAHGVSPEVEAEAVKKQLRVTDATCPLVKAVHKRAAELVDSGFFTILIGHANHPESIGTLGQRPGIYLVEGVDDVAALPTPSPGQPVGFITQTTLSSEEITPVVDALRKRFGKLTGEGDICYATNQRQKAVRELCRQVDVMLIVGSARSSNSNRLREIAAAAGVKAFLLDDASDLMPEMVDNALVIGISAGASAPECLVEALTSRLKSEFGFC